MPKVSPEIARDAWLDLKSKNPQKPVKEVEVKKAASPRQKTAHATEELWGAINKNDVPSFNAALSAGAKLNMDAIEDIIRQEKPGLLNAFFDHPAGQAFIASQKNPKTLSRHLCDALTDTDRDSQASFEMSKMLLDRKIEPSSDWMSYYVLQDEMISIDNPFKRWWVSEGVFEHQWIFKKGLQSYLLQDMLPYLATSPSDFTVFLKTLEKKAPEILIKLKEKKTAASLWANALQSGGYYGNDSNESRVKETCNALIDADILPPLRLTINSDVGYCPDSFKNKSLSWPLFCAVRNDSEGFNFFMKSDTMKELMYEDIQKMSSVFLDLHSFPKLITPHLLAAGFDFDAKNKKRQNVFHRLFRHERVSITKALDEVVRTHAKALLSQKDTKGRTCFEAWKEHDEVEAKISIGGSRLMPMSSYKALVERSLLSQTVGETSTPSKSSSKKRL